MKKLGKRSSLESGTFFAYACNCNCGSVPFIHGWNILILLQLILRVDGEI